MNAEEYLLILTTCPNAEIARKTARGLVESRLAACVNILPSAISIYEWHGKIEEEGEAILYIKTTRARYAEVEAWIKREHPYELPEIIAVSLVRGSPAYLNWISTIVG